MPWDLVVFLAIIGLLTVVVIGYALTQPRSDPPPRGAQIEWFSVGPRYICPNGDCTTTVSWRVDPRDDNVDVTLLMTREGQDPIAFADALEGNMTIEGNASLFSRGPGTYVVVLSVNGELTGEMGRSAIVTVMNPGETAIPYLASDEMTNDHPYGRMSARNTVYIADNPIFETIDGKLPSTFTICSKYAALSAITYVNGHQNKPLSITVRKRDGTVIADRIDVPEGTTVDLNPPAVIEDGLAVLTLMTSGQSPFAVGERILWNIRLTVTCDLS